MSEEEKREKLVEETCEIVMSPNSTLEIYLDGKLIKRKIQR